MNNADMILEKIYKLYSLYETFTWENNNINIDITYKNSTIFIILHDKKVIINDFTIMFCLEENTLYEYIAIMLFIKILGNVKIYNINNTFYNERHRKYVKFNVYDQKLFLMIKEFMRIQDDTFINEDLIPVKTLYNRLSFLSLTLNNFLEKALDDNYDNSRKVLTKYKEAKREGIL